MQRRDFLRAMGCVPFALAAPDVAFAAAPAANYQNLLILIELKGANDGLNTVVPYADPVYARLRPRIGIKRDDVLQLDARTGLHPSLQPLMALWQSQQLAIVQGVGYPDPNLSHFRSIEIWDTASKSNEYLNEGWLTRAFASNPVSKTFAADGVAIGSQDLGPLAGGARALALSNTEQFVRQARLAGEGAKAASNPALAHILKVEGDVVQAAANLGGRFTFRTAFPKHVFGLAVQTAAQVIANKAGVAVVRLTHNGYDTHSNQPAAQQRLLKELAEGISALQSALQELDRWHSTLAMTYAEFGRRPQENGSNGTDHGTANAHFMFGGRVKGGLYGKAPELDRLEGGNLVHGVDFRSLYATIIEKWWGGDARGALGGRFAAMEIIRA